MKILVLNSILFSPQKNVIPQIESIKDTMIYTMCLGFLKAGHQVTLVAASEYKPTQQENFDFDIYFFPSILKRFFLPSVLPFQPALWTFLRKHHKDFDLVLTSEIFALPSLFAAMICPAKTIVWQEMILFQKKFFKIPAILWHYVIIPVLMRKVCVVIPRSVQAQKFISQYCKNVSQDIVDHGVNVEKFFPTETKKRQFVVVSRLIPKKGIESIIDKFSRLVTCHEFTDFKLVIAGKGELESKLKEQVKKLQIENNVYFAGFKPHQELRAFIADSMATLIDTEQDLNMISIPESIVSGTPIITNLVPASASYIAKNHLGIAKAEWDEADLKEMIINNAFYVSNCIAYREKLTNVYCAKKIIEIVK